MNSRFTIALLEFLSLDVADECFEQLVVTEGIALGLVDEGQIVKGPFSGYADGGSGFEVVGEVIFFHL